MITKAGGKLLSSHREPSCKGKMFPSFQSLSVIVASGYFNKKLFNVVSNTAFLPKKILDKEGNSEDWIFIWCWSRSAL